MRVLMKCFYTGPKGNPDLKPGDVHDFKDEAEGQRLIDVGGAELPPAEEKPAEKPAA